MIIEKIRKRIARIVARLIGHSHCLRKLNNRLSRFFAGFGLMSPFHLDNGADYWRSQDLKTQHSPYLYVEYDRTTKLLLDELIEVTGTGAAYLDIGCNAGRNLQYLFEKGFRNLGGIEINRPAVDVVMLEKFPELRKTGKFWVGNAADEIKKLADESYDVVYSHSVLIHIPPKDRSLFADMVRVSKKYIAVMSDENWSYDFEKIFEDLGCKLVEYRAIYENEITKPLPAEKYDEKKHYFIEQFIRIYIKNA